MFHIIQATIAHEFALIKFTIFVKFEKNIFSYVYPVSIFMHQFDSNTVKITVSKLRLILVLFELRL